MCRSMVDIQSATAEIRGDRKIEETTEQNIMAYPLLWAAIIYTLIQDA